MNRPDLPEYFELKIASRLFGRAPESLTQDERRRVRKLAQRQRQIEATILASAEAHAICVAESEVVAGLREIRGRYASAQEFAADLDRQGLSESDLAAAIRRDLQVETILERVACGAPAVTDTEVEIFYHVNRERLRSPEWRRLRHILVTINEAIPDNRRAAALSRIQGVRARLMEKRQSFAELALEVSECPSALKGGMLGDIRRGQLYPVLERVAFALPAGGLSSVVESPLGFHILLCEEIKQAEDLPLEAVSFQIRELLEKRRRRAHQRDWLKRALRE